jgi:hypothetical protein
MEGSPGEIKFQSSPQGSKLYSPQMVLGSQLGGKDRITYGCYRYGSCFGPALTSSQDNPWNLLQCPLREAFSSTLLG